MILSINNKDADSCKKTFKRMMKWIEATLLLWLQSIRNIAKRINNMEKWCTSQWQTELQPGCGQTCRINIAVDSPCPWKQPQSSWIHPIWCRADKQNSHITILCLLALDAKVLSKLKVIQCRLIVQQIVPLLCKELFNNKEPFCTWSLCHWIMFLVARNNAQRIVYILRIEHL